MSAGVCEQPPMSVYQYCRKHMLDHKWIESQKAGYDKGEEAINDWVRRHWTGFLRARWVEHLQGKQRWAELSMCDFGLLQRRFQDRQQLLDAILDQLVKGKENLDVLDWAYSTQKAIEPVVEILIALDVNSSRLQHRFDPEPPKPE